MSAGNEPAYPVNGTMGEVVHAGMTQRQVFALAAMQGLLANPNGPVQTNAMTGWGFVNVDPVGVASIAFEMADAMLAEGGDHSAEAIAAWNRRAALQAPGAEPVAWELVETVKVPVGVRPREATDGPLMPPEVTVWETHYRWRATVLAVTKTPTPPKAALPSARSEGVPEGHTQTAISAARDSALLKAAADGLLALVSNPKKGRSMYGDFLVPHADYSNLVDGVRFIALSLKANAGQ